MKVIMNETCTFDFEVPDHMDVSDTEDMFEYLEANYPDWRAGVNVTNRDFEEI